MKKIKIGSETATIELNKKEISLLVYCCNTSNGKLNEKDNAIIEQLKALEEYMDAIKKIEVERRRSYEKKV